MQFEDQSRYIYVKTRVVVDIVRVEYLQIQVVAEAHQVEPKFDTAFYFFLIQCSDRVRRIEQMLVHQIPR